MAGTGTSHLRSADDALLRVEDLVVEFPVSGGRTVHAVSGISFDLLEGETLGLVGESGCGKSSSGRAILQLRPPTSGSVRLEGVELTELDHRELRRMRTRLQMVFQDPISSLNPRRRVRDIVAEGLDIWGRPDDADQRIDDTLRAVGLDPDVVGDRRPHEFSGGQCQRISIARALIMDPQVLVCDEPVSALDVSVQAQILNLLHDMRGRFGLTMIFIAHDLSVVNHIADRVMVMYLGKVCEVAAPGDLFRNPHHPYTELLISSIPKPDPRVGRSDPLPPGEMPSPTDPPGGCRFRTRCPHATDRCANEEPALVEISTGRHVACHHPLP
ncbi:MAG: ABC transporter ATP-binding protein [Acidimicrobiales bacterium]|nr:MAG: ABC transporter ATP-binding protein [Acidimicrobiales bacterium]